MEEFRFQPGDRVQYISSDITDGNNELTPGCVGTVVAYEYDYVGVAWDHYMTLGHDLEGKCKDGYGYWVRQDRIALDVADDDMPAVDDMEFAEVLFHI